MTDEYFLPFPETCPYNAFCEVSGELEKRLGSEAMLCTEGKYICCPAYATQYRSDFMNCLSNAVMGAVWKRLSMLEIVIGDNIMVQDTEAAGFRETESAETDEEKVLKDLRKGKVRDEVYED